MKSCIAVAAFLGTALAGPLRRDVPSSAAASVLPASTASVGAPTNGNITDENLNQLLLMPAVHWDHDSNDLNNLKPNQSHSIYFTPEGGNADPSQHHAFIHANITMQSPTVILDHCGTIKTVKCGTDGVSVTFENKEAFDTAKTYWNTNVTLGTNTDDCGQLTHQASFWDVQALNFNEGALSVLATVDKEIDIGAHTAECSAAWGSWEPSEEMSSLSPSSSVAGAAAQITAPPTLDPRGSPWDFITSVGGGVISDIKSVGNGVVSDVKSVGGGVVSDIKSVGGGAISAIKSVADVHTTSTLSIPLSAKPTTYDAAAPWPSAFKVADKNGFKAYCVDCYTKGNVKVVGILAWNVLERKVTQATADMTGDLEAQLIMGLDADGQINLPTVTVPVFSTNAEKLLAHSLFSIGPYFQVEAKLETSIQMKGQAKLGTKVNMDMGIHLDLHDNSKSSHSFPEPKFSPVADANATIGLTASVGLPIEIGLDLSIEAIGFSKKVALTESPKVIGHIEASLGTNAAESKCQGLPWDVSFNNDLYFTAWDKEFDIFNKTWPLANGCIPLKLPGAGKSSSVASSVHSGTISNAQSSTISSAHGSITDSASAHSSAAAGTGKNNPLIPNISAIESILHQSHASSSTAAPAINSVMSAAQSAGQAAASAVQSVVSAAQSAAQSTSTAAPAVNSVMSAAQSAGQAAASAVQSAASAAQSAAHSTSTAAPAPYSAASAASAAQAAVSAVQSAAQAAVSAAQSAVHSAPAAASSANSASTTAPAAYSSATSKAQSSSTTCTDEEVATSSKPTQSTATTFSSKTKSVEASSTSSKVSSSSVRSAQITPDIIEPTPVVY